MSNLIICTIISLFHLINNINCNLVIDLTEYSLEEFKSELENYQATLVKFFVPHCPHCRSLISDYITSAVTIHDEELPIKFAEVDCSDPNEGKIICSSHNIRSYPTIILFKSSLLYKKFTGRRDFKSIVNWLKIYAIDRSTQIQSTVNLQISLKENYYHQDVTIILGIFKNIHDKSYDIWMKSLKKLTDCQLFSQIKVSMRKEKREKEIQVKYI